MLFSGFKTLQKRIYSHEAAYEYENSKKMVIVSKCLVSESLKRKLQGLNELKDIVRSLTHSSERNKQIVLYRLTIIRKLGLKAKKYSIKYTCSIAMFSSSKKAKTSSAISSVKTFSRCKT